MPAEQAEPTVPITPITPVAPIAPIAPTTRAPATPSAPRSVLVVDDNVEAAESMAMALELSGHTVTLAFDGPQALAAATASMPQIVLLDLALPKLSGLEVARRMRHLDGGKTTRIIAVTGYGEPRDHKATAAAGIDLHLTKPVDMNALTDLLV
jgi:two-component system CheB/CheR fusion protein